MNEMEQKQQQQQQQQNNNKVNSHSNWLFVFSPQQCNSIIKGWLHCLRSESKGRFFANNILLA